MIKQLFSFLALAGLLFLLGIQPANAAKTFRISGNGFNNLELVSVSCAGVISLIATPGNSHGAGGTCSGLEDAALSDNSVFNFTYPDGVFQQIGLTRSGTCTAGNVVGNFEVAAGYGVVATNHVTQVFGDPDPFSYKGCMVVVADTISCYTKTGDAEVAAGIKKVYCNESFKENGDDGGADGSPSVSEVPYNGGGTGGGTDPGTGGGGTDPGTGGGGGTDPGTGGGGGTDPGTGGGGTDPGGGGTNPGGGTGGGDGTDFCGRHPGSSICQNSGVSGNCATFTCNGDAIQCSILREVHEANCKAAADDAAADSSGIGKLGKGVLEGNDPDGDKLPRPGSASQISMPSLDSSGWLGGGECFADKVLSVMGHQITIPFSRACGALIVFRYAIMVVAALISFKLLSGAIIRE